MSLSIVILFMLLFTIAMPILLGIKIFNNKRKLAILVLLIPIFTLSLAFNFIYNLQHKTTPDDLQLQLTQYGPQVTLTGKWLRKYERYSYGKDFIAISLPENTEIINYNLESFVIKRDEDSYLLNEIISVLEANPNYDSTKETVLFKIDLQREFKTDFILNRIIDIEDAIVQYIHVYYPPMDSFYYWVKTANGSFPDPLDMYR